MPETTFAELQAKLDDVLAEKSELLLRIKRREMVELETLKRLVTERGHATRDLLLIMMPARQAAALAATHGLNPSTVLTTLTSTMRAALTAISKEGPRALSARPPPDGRT